MNKRCVTLLSLIVSYCFSLTACGISSQWQLVKYPLHDDTRFVVIRTGVVDYKETVYEFNEHGEQLEVHDMHVSDLSHYEV